MTCADSAVSTNEHGAWLLEKETEIPINQSIIQNVSKARGLVLWPETYA